MLYIDIYTYSNKKRVDYMKKIYIKNVKDENAITLISVVVTIVILIILTAITVKFNKGDSSIEDLKTTEPIIKSTITTTTSSITLSEINTYNIQTITEECYDIYFNDATKPYATNKTKDDIISLNGLKDNTQYSIIIEGKTSGLKRKKIVKTNQLYVTELLMKKADLSDYNSGE